jgi:hypothetical protein
VVSARVFLSRARADPWQKSQPDGILGNRQLLIVRIIGVPLNADRPLEARGQWASLVGVAIASADRRELHMHARAGPPPIHNDTVEIALTVAGTASNERLERALPSLDLINRLERIDWHGDVAGGAQSVIKNLTDKSAGANITSDGARHETPNCGWLVIDWRLHLGGYPFREPDDNTSVTFGQDG